MPANKSLFRHSLLAVVTFCVAALLPSAPVLADDHVALPDVLDMPAMAARHAQNSLQLGISRAGDRLVSVGERGIVLLSDDEGRSWRQARHVPVSVTLTDVEFVSAEHGWAVGHSGVLLFSGDGGETWERRMDGSQAAEIVLQGAREQLALGVEGAERAVRNAEFLVEDGPDKPFLNITFANRQTGYLVGAYGLALHTRDGGESWQSLGERIPNAQGNHLYQVLLNGDQLMLVGEQGAVFRSDDHGLSFEKLAVPYAGTFFGALTLENQGVLLFGLQGNVWRSLDAGDSWDQVEMDQPVTFAAGMRSRDGTLLLADESGHLLRSDNNGASFVELPISSGAGATALLETSNGAMVVSSMRGVRRLEVSKLVAGGRQ